MFVKIAIQALLIFGSLLSLDSAIDRRAERKDRIIGYVTFWISLAMTVLIEGVLG